MTITLNIHTTAHKNQIQKNQTRFTQRPRSQIRRPVSQFTKKHASWERRRGVPFVANSEVEEGEERGLASVDVGRREHQHERFNHTRCGELRARLRRRRRRFPNHLPYLPRGLNLGAEVPVRQRLRKFDYLSVFSEAPCRCCFWFCFCFYFCVLSLSHFSLSLAVGVCVLGPKPTLSSSSPSRFLTPFQKIQTLL